MTAPIANLTSSDLKKQSQFAPARIGAKPYVKGDYGNITALSARKNKANQSQYADLRSEIRSSKSEIRNKIKTVEAGREIGIIKRKRISYEPEVKYAFESSQFR